MKRRDTLRGTLPLREDSSLELSLQEIQAMHAAREERRKFRKRAERVGAKIPSADPRDASDVVWALTTAQAMWEREEFADAIRWLGRAAEAAAESSNVPRFSELSDSLRKLEGILGELGEPPEPMRPRPVATSVSITMADLPAEDLEAMPTLSMKGNYLAGAEALLPAKPRRGAASAPKVSQAKKEAPEFDGSRAVRALLARGDKGAYVVSPTTTAPTDCVDVLMIPLSAKTDLLTWLFDRDA